MGVSRREVNGKLWSQSSDKPQNPKLVMVRGGPSLSGSGRGANRAKIHHRVGEGTQIWKHIGEFYGGLNA